MLDDEDFLNGKISVKHAQNFSAGEKQEFKQNVEPPNVNSLNIVSRSADLKS